MTAPPRPLRVAIGGRMQVGKTTAAMHLVERHGFERLALADPIKDIARREFGWDGAKDARGRRLLQEVGDVGRHYAPDVWLERLAVRVAAAPAARLVVDDLRLAPEAEFLRGLGFATALVVRPPELVPAQPGADSGRHATETGLDAARLDREIDNGGTFEELYARLDDWVAELEAGRVGG